MAQSRDRWRYAAKQMGGAIRKLAVDSFPDTSPEDVISQLVRIGDGIRHVPSTRLYKSLMDWASGDYKLLCRTIDHALSSDADIRAYLKRRSDYLWYVDSMARYPQYKFLVPLVRALADFAADFAVAMTTSHKTQRLTCTKTDETRLYIIPAADEQVVISLCGHESNWELSIPPNLAEDSLLVAAVDAVPVVSGKIEYLFERVTRFHNAA